MKLEERNECKNVREFQERFATGEFEDGSFDKQCEAGWYDWFCDDSALVGKTRRLGKVVAQIKDGGKVDLDKNRVIFKNNCPMVGPLYDDIRIGDDEGNLFVIALDDERSRAGLREGRRLRDGGTPSPEGQGDVRANRRS